MVFLEKLTIRNLAEPEKICYYRQVVDYSMKLFPFAFFAFSALVVSALPQPAQALPFKKNCSSMQSYYNNLKWNTPTTFQGFENQSLRHSAPGLNSVPDPGKNEQAICGPGYITEISPMGKKVCQGYLNYTIYYDGQVLKRWDQDGCRYK